MYGAEDEQCSPCPAMPRLTGEDWGGEYGACDVWILAIGVSREMMTINVTPIMLEYDKDYWTSVIFVRS